MTTSMLLHEGLPESLETSEIHLDILTNLKRINFPVSAIAHAIREALGGRFVPLRL